MRVVRRKAEKNERRWDRYGEFRSLAFAEGWIMYRRKGAATGAMPLKEWDALSDKPITK